MIATIQQGFTQGKNDLTPVVDRLLDQLRRAANQVASFGPILVSSSGSGAAAAWTSEELPQNSAWSVTAYVHAIEAGDPFANSSRVIKDASYVRQTGAGILLGQNYWLERQAILGGVNFSLTADNEMQLDISSRGFFTLSWFIWLEVRGGAL